MRSNEKLLEKNAADGNLPIDMLFCVPPGDQVQGEQGKSRSNLARNLSEWGHDVWDGTDLEVRRSAPIRVSQHRVVQYDSCRGLEGWIVVDYALDDFLTYKFESCPLTSGDGMLFEDERTRRYRFAMRWATIPLTRAIDTQVIQLVNPESEFSRRLLELARQLDFVEIVG